MLKRNIKIIVATLIIFSILATLTILFNTNKSIAYSVGQTVPFISLANNDNLYCIERTAPFRVGYYYCISAGKPVEREVAYLVATRESKNGSNAISDVISNVIWYLDGDGVHPGMEEETRELLEIATVAAAMKDPDSGEKNLEIIEAPASPIIEDGSNLYGPFVINYPQGSDGELAGGKVTILLNGREVEKETAGLAEFYFTEEDGILYGEENTVEIIYEATYYTGTYADFRPYAEYEKELECPKCGATNIATVEAVKIDGTLKILGRWDYDEDKKHKTDYVWVDEENQWVEKECSKDGEWYEEWGDDDEAELTEAEKEALREWGYNGEEYRNQDEFQEVRYIETEEKPIREVIPYNFYIKPNIEIDLNKIDSANQSIEGIEFNVNVTGGILDGSNKIVTSAEGNKITIKPTEVDTITLTLTETQNKYYMDIEPIVITFEYRAGRWTPIVGTEREQVSISGDNIRIFGLNVQNIAKIQNLRLIKLNSSVLGETIPDVTFRITLANAKTLSGGQLITGTTDSNGEIDLGILEVIDPSQEIVITLEEVAVPVDGLNYNGLYESKDSATITFMHKQAGTASSHQLVDANYDLATNNVSLNVENIVTMDLSGMVWLDGQTGLKPVKSPNGAKDSSEKGVPGVTVNLVRDDGILYINDITDSNGNYEFKDVPASVTGLIKYNVEFVYDGINYVATQVGKDSDATEVNRQEFNNKFATIIKDNATDINGTKTSLEYAYNGDEAILQTMSGNTVKDKFIMLATTKPTVYDKNTSGIDLGLVKKGVDLAAVTDIYEAKVSINGEDRIYDYNDIQKLEKDNNNNPILDNLEKNVRYNLYLYNSDYNYRIGDYILSGVRDDTLTVNKNNASSSLYEQRVNDGELNVEVTYQILLNNQSATDATINQIAYYYDTKYMLTDILTDGVTAVGNPVLATINGTTYNKVILNVNQEFTDSDNQGIVELLFTVAKDASGNVYTGIMQNLVEIISYSTKTSCIDDDSAPYNITAHSNEDDTDDAAGLNVQLNNIERAVSGYIFEDAKSNNPGQYNTGNGKYDNSEDKIDDVIVQLIEIKNVTVGNTTLRLEYIWQETVSGSNKVTYVTSDGKSKAEYTVNNEPGHYTFNKNIIPGDYIVRFVYGDGTYYDTDSAENLLKYNGQDYKSTTDIYYNKPYYDTSYPANNSMARDNEARRLEVMAYATSITANDASKLQIDSKEELNNTWMCAETSLILMKVSDAEVEGDNVNSIVRGVNFGLVERPRAYLVLEKHITGLKITGIVEGNTTLENYDNANGKVELSYNSGEGILATATSKINNTIGDWIIETETDEIGGKKLDITYGYRITNIGDSDYIGEKLSEQLTAGKTYSQIASEAKTLSSNPNYTPGAYLGTAYYNGNKTTDVVASIPFQIEDYMGLEEGLELDTTSDFKAANTNISKNVWTYQDTASSEKTPIIAEEQVNVVQTKNILKLYTNQQTYFNYPLRLTVYDASLDSTSTRKDFTYRSYAAQLIYPTSGTITSETGSVCDGNITLGNLNTIKTYVEESSVPVSTVVPEVDESIAETVIITMDTGDDKVTPVMFIVSITAGLAVVAVGIVLVKKFVIK